MTSSRSAFKLVDRGFSKTLLLVPGWATDHRVFAGLDLDFNYLLPVKCATGDFVKECVRAMDDAKIDKVSACGWSLGGFLACDLFKAYPGRIEALILIGMREKYEACQLSEVRAHLDKSRAGYLYKFYAECFSTDEKDLLAWFKANLIKSYLREMESEILLKGLDYLERARLDTESLGGAKVRFIHGSGDRIAPVKGLARALERLPGAAFTLVEGAGHMPFLSSGFKEALSGG
jgi:pimeloyl-ACP methyl ester carboxylesterase